MLQGLEKIALELIPKMSNTAINQISSNKYTALFWACYKGLEKVALELIPKMTNEVINHVDNDGYTYSIISCIFSSSTILFVTLIQFVICSKRSKSVTPSSISSISSIS